MTDGRTDGQTDGQTDGRTDGGDCNIPYAFLKKRGDNKIIFWNFRLTKGQLAESNSLLPPRKLHPCRAMGAIAYF